jgi:hypothetical protein
MYGKPIRTVANGEIAVSRDGGIVTVEVPNAGLFTTPLFRLGYPQALQLIARLQEAANDAAREKR